MSNFCIETAFDYIRGEPHATYTTGEKRLISKLLKYASEYPDDVKILHRPEDNDGHIVAHIPFSWLKVSPPRKVSLTDEQRADRADRLRLAKQKNN